MTLPLPPITNSPLLRAAVLAATFLSPLAAQASCNTVVTEQHQASSTNKTPSTHTGTFILGANAAIFARIKVTASAGFIGAIWQNRSESVEGFSGRTYMLVARPTAAEYEARVEGKMSITADAQSFTSIWTGAHADVYGHMSANSQVLGIHVADQDAAAVSNMSSGSISVGVSPSPGPNGTTIGGSMTITPSSPTSGPQNASVNILTYGNAVSTRCDLTLISSGKVNVKVSAFGLLRTPEATGTIDENDWLGTFIDAYCPGTTDLLHHWEWNF